jgi:hypothetical protein
MVAVITVLALVLLRGLDTAPDTGSGTADETEMIVDASSVICPLGHFAGSDQNRGSGVQSSKTIKAAVNPVDGKSSMVKNQTVATRGLGSEAPEILDGVVMWFPGGGLERCRKD